MFLRRPGTADTIKVAEEKMSFTVHTYGDPKADVILIQMVDDHDMETIQQEAAYIREMTEDRRFCLRAVHVNSWNKDLSPWPAPAVFGKEDFGDGAGQTLEFLLTEVMTGPDSEHSENEKVFLGGYSLAGLFALWAGYQTDRFSGIAAASPSIWFPQFTGYMRENRIRAEAVYLSLGDREERTRNPVMAGVGTAIKEGYSILTEAGTDCVLEWNKGNHFKEPDLRTAKAFAWLMNRGQG